MRKHRIQKKENCSMDRRIILAIAVIIGLAAIGAVVYAGMDKEENKQKVAMTELPAAVQKTIQDNLGGGTVTETEKETKDGKTYYEAQVKNLVAIRSRSRSLRMEASSASGRKTTTINS